MRPRFQDGTLWFLDKPGDGEFEVIDLPKLRGKDRPGRIRCPKCAWEPRKEDRWQCRCLHLWNTFDTRGACPACSLKWQVTQCLHCLTMSPHEDWYEKGDQP